MRTYILILLIISFAMSYGDDSGQFRYQHKTMTPVDFIKSELYGIPILLEMASKQFKSDIQYGSKERLGREYLDYVCLLYGLLVIYECKFIEYAESNMDKLKPDDLELYKKIKKQQSSGKFPQADKVTSLKVNEVIDILYMKYNTLYKDVANRR